MKQYNEYGDIWQCTIAGNYKCYCGCNVFHREYNKARGKIWYICNACNCVVAEIKDEYMQECLNIGIWK